MKFGRLLALSLRGIEDWPSIRYDALKRSIERRACSHREGSLFATGTFKKALRDDILAINKFWQERERMLLAAGSGRAHGRNVRQTFKTIQ